MSEILRTLQEEVCRRTIDRFDRGIDEILGGTATTNSSVPEATLTVRSLYDVMETIEQSVPRRPVLTEIKVTRDAVRMAQNKIYPKRRAKNKAHHQRMNNKWRRRYGVSYLPAAYTIPRARLWVGGEELVALIHPDLLKGVLTIPGLAQHELAGVRVTY